MRFFLFLLLAICLWQCSGPITSEETPPPNVVLILADDLGWADLACYGSSFYETPNLDALAADGIRFTNGYASCPVCSPTRASVFTGQYPSRTGITDWIPGRAAFRGPEPENRFLANEMDNQLALEYETIAERLQDAGYQTFFAGKWHLGEAEAFWPESQGFAVNIGGFSKGSPSNNRKQGCYGYFSPYCNPRLTDGPEGEYLTDRLGQETVAFIDTVSTPFFVTFATYQVHTPLLAKEAHIQKYRAKRAAMGIDSTNEIIEAPDWVEGAIPSRSFRERRIQGHPTYAGMVQSLDENVGRILQTLKDKELYENTLIVFTSDNGGLSTAEGSPTSNLPLRAGKGWLYEGGIRVPFIWRRPAETRAGSTDDRPISSIDIMPSILDYLELPQSELVDGVSVFGEQLSAERPLFWHYPHYANQGGNPGSVIRRGQYKLIHDFETGAKLLFDLVADPGEQNNLAAEQPDLVAELYAQLEAWRASANAELMRPNPEWNQAEVIVQ